MNYCPYNYLQTATKSGVAHRATPLFVTLLNLVTGSAEVAGDVFVEADVVDHDSYT